MRIVFSILLIFFSLVCHSQKVESRSYGLTTVYTGVNNPVFYAVEGYACNAVSLSAGKGIITENGPCEAVFRPGRNQGYDTLFVYKKGSKEKVGELIVEVVNPPDPVVYVGWRLSGNIPKIVLEAQNSILADAAVAALRYQLRYEVTSYMAIIMRDTTVIYSKACTGNVFSEELKNVFKSLKPNDRVIFSSIVVKLPGDVLTKVAPLEYSIMAN